MLSSSRNLIPALALAAAIVAMSLHSGCSNRTAPQSTGSVRGRVTFQGEPVAGAMIVFVPDRERGSSGKPLRAETGADGLFELKGPEGAAVPPGWYRVAIAPPADASATLSHFPAPLRRPDTSTLVREVTAGTDHAFEFAVEVPSSRMN